ncbi:MAG TPA: CdaR family protein [candidate division Zixibacteria bacterium]|nr:CdaR family protein [candidate division Zixibacteria bacterium]
MGWLLRNWHLKLAALGLATVLYTGLVYSGSFVDEEFPGVPVRSINLPEGAYPLTQQFEPIDVTYRLPSDSQADVEVDDFVATVDLSAYDMDDAPNVQPLPIEVRSAVPDIQILDWEPRTAPVALDRLGQKEVPVFVNPGEVPEGLSISTPRVAPREVTAAGPQSQITQVVRAVAQVQIFESGIDVTNQQVTLLPVDVNGRQVESVELDPSTATVNIAVSTVETSKTVPVRPSLVGTPANGFEIVGVSADPSVISLLGTPDALAPVTQVATADISVAGSSETVEVTAPLQLPAGTRLAEDAPDVTVTVEIEPALATRTLLVGLECTGAEDGMACLPQQGQVAVTLEGTAVALAAIDPADVTPVLDVSGLGPGQHTVTPSVTLPDGVSLVSISPGSVPVILQPPATPTPTPPG